MTTVDYYHKNGCMYCIRAEPVIQELKQHRLFTQTKYPLQFTETEQQNAPAFIHSYPTIAIGQQIYPANIRVETGIAPIVSWIRKHTRTRKSKRKTKQTWRKGKTRKGVK